MIESMGESRTNSILLGPSGSYKDRTNGNPMGKPHSVLNLGSFAISAARVGKS